MIIYVTNSGEKEYVGGTLTELTGKDITAANFAVALGLSDTIPPTSAGVTPSVNVQGPTVADRLLKLLVDNTVSPGTYFIWGKVVDTPESRWILLDGEPIIVV
jgi:hypothetical protein